MQPTATAPLTDRLTATAKVVDVEEKWSTQSKAQFQLTFGHVRLVKQLIPTVKHVHRDAGHVFVFSMVVRICRLFTLYAYLLQCA